MEQETETKIVRQDEVTDGSDETPAQSGCLNTLVVLLTATLVAFVVGAGICAGGFYVVSNDTLTSIINNSGVGVVLFYIWMGASFIVPIIVFIWIWANSYD